MAFILKTIVGVVVLLSFALCRAEQIQVVTEDLRPYQYIDEHGKETGFGMDVIEHLLARLKVNVKVNFYPWARAYEIALKRKNVLIFSISRTDFREKKFHWIGKLAQEDHFYFALKKNTINYVSDNDLKRFSIGVNRSSPNHQYLIEHNFPNIEPTSNVKQSVKMLLEGRVDLIFGAQYAYKTIINANGYDFDQVYALNPKPVLTNDLFIAMSLSSNPDFVESVKSAYLLLENEGVITRLRKKWGLLY